MSDKRRTFSTQFKCEAAALVIDQHYTYPAACEAVGVGESALRRWVKQLTEERTGVTPKSKALTADQQRIQALETQVKRLEMEKTILKRLQLS
jgi:transposase-like protein